MGATLSEPLKVKNTKQYETEQLKVVASSMQGWRVAMEDEHIVRLNVQKNPISHLFAVFDGHGGKSVSEYAADNLAEVLTRLPAYVQGDYMKALKNSFMNIDQNLRRRKITSTESVGSTAVCLLIRGTSLFCANIGDSRAVASVRGHPQFLSFDHKPHVARENKRIMDAGGFVNSNRVNGDLAMTRAFGDFLYKNNRKLNAQQQIVTAEPDIILKEITRDHEFVVMASDGIWDVVSAQEVVKFVRGRIAKKIPISTICEELLDMCIADEDNITGIGCDNMTLIIVAFTYFFPYDEAVQRCANPVQLPIPDNCLPQSYPNQYQNEISNMLGIQPPGEVVRQEQIAKFPNSFFH